MEVRETQCFFLPCFLVQQKSQEVVLSSTWAWSHLRTPRLTVHHPSSGENVTCELSFQPPAEVLKAILRASPCIPARVKRAHTCPDDLSAFGAARLPVSWSWF